MSNGVGDADEIELVYLSDLATAQPGSDTDTFAICQNAGGCSSGEPLVQMSLAQLKAYIGASPVSGGSAGMSLIGVAKALDVSVATQYLVSINLPAGQAYVISDVYCINSTPSGGLITDGGATLYSDPDDVGQIVNLAFYMFSPTVPNSFIWFGNSSLPQISYSSSTLYLSTDAGSTNTPATPPALVDIYVFGFPL